MTEKGTFQTKVVNIPELLEAILLHLDIRTLLVSAQRVCQPWTALIQTSPAIQQALFFQPKQGKWQTKSSGSSILSSTTENNDTKLDEGSINGYESGFPSPQLIYNPLLVQAFRPFFPSAHEYPPIQNAYDEKATEVQTQPYFSHKALDMLSSPQKKIAYMRKEASWRKMLLRQPPVYGGVTIFKMHHGRGGDSCRCYEVRFSVLFSLLPVSQISTEVKDRRRNNLRNSNRFKKETPTHVKKRKIQMTIIIH